MTWLAWRQLRTPALVGALVLVAVAVLFGVTGPNLFHLFDTYVKPCHVHNDCNSVISSFLAKDRIRKTVSKLLIFFPVLLGMFWGAPLVAREMETGTFRLSWTQSVTRRRWFATRVGMAVLASMVATALLSLMITWWSRPFDSIVHFPFGTFDQRDIVPIGYAAFTVMLGVAAGALLRRTIPAMGVTLAGFAAMRYFVTDWIRVRLESAISVTTKFGATVSNGGQSITSSVGQGLHRGDWVVSNSVVNKAGQAVLSNGNIGFQHLADGKTEFLGVGVCPNTFPARHLGGTHVRGVGSALTKAFQQCIDSFHLRNILTYQPAGRYWPFQWEEMAIFLLLAAILGAFSYWWIRRRVT